MAPMPSPKCTSLKSAAPGHSIEFQAWHRDMIKLSRVFAGFLAIAACVFAALPLRAAEDLSPDASLTRLLQEQRAALPGACSQTRVDRLIRILCSGEIRIGVRD